MSPLSSQRHKRQRGRPRCCANLNARIVIPLAGSARDWLNLHLSPQRKEGQNCCQCFLLFYFFSPPPPPLIALSSPSALAIFGPQLFVLASAQKKEVPFQKRAIGMMGRQFFSEGKCYSFFPSKGKLKYNKIKSLDNLRRHQHHWSCHRNELITNKSMFFETERDLFVKMTKKKFAVFSSCYLSFPLALNVKENPLKEFWV